MKHSKDQFEYIGKNIWTLKEEHHKLAKPSLNKDNNNNRLSKSNERTTNSEESTSIIINRLEDKQKYFAKKYAKVLLSMGQTEKDAKTKIKNIMNELIVQLAKVVNDQVSELKNIFDNVQEEILSVKVSIFIHIFISFFFLC